MDEDTTSNSMHKNHLETCIIVNAYVTWYACVLEWENI